MEQTQLSNEQRSPSPAVYSEPDPPPPLDPPDLDLGVTNDRTEQAREASIADAGSHVLHSLPPFSSQTLQHFAFAHALLPACARHLLNFSFAKFVSDSLFSFCIHLCK